MHEMYFSPECLLSAQCSVWLQLFALFQSALQQDTLSETFTIIHKGRIGTLPLAATG